jgi:hypothetical protein
VSVDDILTVGDGPVNPLGLETEDYSNSVIVSLATSPFAVGSDEGDLDGDHNFDGVADGATLADWVGVTVTQGGLFSLVTNSWDSSGGSSGNLSMGIYNATTGAMWATTAAAFTSSGGAPITLSLAAGDYLIQLFGDISLGGAAELVNYTLEITTVIPVPAAVWLFGTAMLGLFGLRRKAKMGAAAA